MSSVPPPPPQQPIGLQPHRGTMILIFGILSIVCCGIIFGPIAWIMANTDMQKMQSGVMDPAGEGTTKAGKICGIIGTVLAIIGIIYQIVAMTMGIGAMSTATL